MKLGNNPFYAVSPQEFPLTFVKFLVGVVEAVGAVVGTPSGGNKTFDWELPHLCYIVDYISIRKWQPIQILIKRAQLCTFASIICQEYVWYIACIPTIFEGI